MGAKELLQKAIRQMQARVRQLKRAAGQQEDLLWLLFQVEKALVASGADVPRGRRNLRSMAGPPRVALECRWEALAGGAAQLSFDGGAPVKLPPTLAGLAGVLLSEDGQSPDALLAWKSLEPIAQLLEKRMGRAFSAHSVSNLLWRLAKAFENAGIEKELIERTQRKGARLRVKRGPRALS